VRRTRAGGAKGCGMGPASRAGPGPLSRQAETPHDTHAAAEPGVLGRRLARSRRMRLCQSSAAGAARLTCCCALHIHLADRAHDETQEEALPAALDARHDALNPAGLLRSPAIQLLLELQQPRVARWVSGSDGGGGASPSKRASFGMHDATLPTYALQCTVCSGSERKCGRRRPPARSDDSNQPPSLPA
jgi:hypothetical protein